MTPEEYDAAREYLSENWADEIKMAEHFENALQHIDAQAAQISDLKRQIITLSDSVVSVESRKDRQIEAMKEKLVESEARRLYPFTVPMWANLPDEDFTQRTFGGMEERHGKAFYRHEAHQQLKTEMPEVGWE